MDDIEKATTLSDLQDVYNSFFGKNGKFTKKFKQINDLSKEERVVLNKESNDLKECFKKKKEEIEKQEILKKLSRQKIDVTLTPFEEQKGFLHPLTKSFEDIAKILSSLGFSFYNGPEIETDWYNFTALNTPLNHPARDMQDTFFLENKNVMRTQTSSSQIRSMEKNSVPIKMFSIGATYRREMDATHTPMFRQVEGLYIDKNINLKDLIYHIKYFLKKYFALKNIELRIRPSYFPFTEPSIEIDIKWKESKWLEIMGAGLVHPNVLKNCNVDPNKYQGFAFGFGLDRLTMLKYNILDIRKLYDGDIRFLQQAGFSILEILK